MNKDDRQLILDLYDKYNRGERIRSEVLTDLYNRVLNRHEHNTNCGTCLRSRLFDLVKVLDKLFEEGRKKLTDEDREFLNWAKQLPSEHYPSYSRVVEIYNRIFNANEEENSCLPCLRKLLNNLYVLL